MRNSFFRVRRAEDAQYFVAESGLPLAALAHRAGVTRQHMWMVIRGDRATNERVAQALCDALQLPEYVLFVDANDRPAWFGRQRAERVEEEAAQ